MLSAGEGMGRRTYNTIKSLVSDEVSLPSFEDCQGHIKKKILPPSISKIKTEGETTVGVYYAPEELLTSHLLRWLEVQQDGDKVPAPGDYHCLVKLGSDGSRHTLFSHGDGERVRADNPTTTCSITTLTVLKVEGEDFEVRNYF